MTGGDGPSPFGPMLVMVSIFAIFYFLVMRPQQKKQRDEEQARESFRAGLKKNDEVVAAGGLYGRVVEIKASVVWVELAPNVRVKVDRRSIEAPSSRTAKADDKEKE
jgi:preprotein translocase subunit YajC